MERAAAAATQDEVERATAAGSGICRDLSELGYCDCDCFHIRVTRTHCGLFCDLYWKGLWVFPPVTHVSSSLYVMGGRNFPRFAGMWSQVGFLPGLATTVVIGQSDRLLKCRCVSISCLSLHPSSQGVSTSSGLDCQTIVV